MKKDENQDACRTVRREMSRHAIDCAEVQVSSSHGVISLHGRVRPMRGHESTFESQTKAFLTALRQRPGIRDINVEWTFIQ